MSVDEIKKDKFWADDFSRLFIGLNPFPNSKMTREEKLNSLSRFIIIISVILYFFNYKYWIHFLLFSLMGVMLMERTSLVENFSVPPTLSTEHPYSMITVPPLHGEEWRVPPPQYDHYTMQPPPAHMYTDVNQPIFGQYLGVSSMLPYHEEATKNVPLKDVKMFMNDEFTKNVMEHRNDMSRLYMNKMNREYRHGCYDQVSP